MTHHRIVIGDCLEPLDEKTVAGNVLKYGVGGLNINECRLPYVSDSDKLDFSKLKRVPNQIYGGGKGTNLNINPASERGRFPSNVILDEAAAGTLELVTPPGGLVLDPFLGTGTLTKAAQNLNFSSIGIELDDVWIPVYKKRLRMNEQLQTGAADFKIVDLRSEER